MGQKIRDIMSKRIVALDASASPRDAARSMRDKDIGCVVVEKDKQLCGIITDRDLVVRGLAEDGLDRDLGSFCSTDITSIGPDADVGDAVKLMEKNAIRRIPVVDNGRTVGIISLGDLAQTRDPNSALGQISSAPPNR
jgi:CBS domain-containing protein